MIGGKMNTKSMALKATGFAVVFALVSSAGTAHAWGMPKMFSLDNTWPFRDKDKPQQGIPVRIVGAWTDTVMTQAGQKPQRGFGGRIMFYDKEGKKPILVDGQLVVYAFDETNRQPTDNKPTRRYVFPADQMAIHMSKCDMGASYSFWLPWDDAGGPKTEVGLICRFEPKGGAVVTGEQTHHLLPGTVNSSVATSGPPKVPEGVRSKPPRQTLEDIQAKRNAEQQSKQTSFEAPIQGGQLGPLANAGQQEGTSPERHLTAATISLPQNYQMPDTATLNAAIQSAGYQQTPRQLPPNPAQLQQRMPASSPAAFPVVQAVGQSPVGSNPAMGQVQLQAYQQSSLQQPMMQPPMIQPPPIRPPQSSIQTWTQTPSLSAPATAVNSPASAQYR
jgi:hypothetical protein